MADNRGANLQSDNRPQRGQHCRRSHSIIAKRRSAPYRSGRGGEWRKIKCVQSESFVIIGYEPSHVALGGIGRLLLAARRAGHLVYVGGVGTGFTQATGAALRKEMDKLIIAKPAVAMTERKRGYRWLVPELIAEIAFRGGPTTTSCATLPTRDRATARMRPPSSSFEPERWPTVLRNEVDRS